jgi:HNH endonuclease
MPASCDAEAPSWSEYPCIETDWVSRNSCGYGRRTVRDPRKRTELAHRVALEEKLGRPLRPGYESCHRCDNPPCVQPEHLYEGTHAENMRDMSQRGRSPGWPAAAQARGVAASVALRSVAPNRREEIRRRYSAGGISQIALAREYGISQQTVSNIVRRQFPSVEYTDSERWAERETR